MARSGRTPNQLLAGWLNEARLSKAALRAALIELAQQRGQHLDVSLRTIARWLNEGDQPRSPMPELIAAVIAARVGEDIEPGDLGWFRWPRTAGNMSSKAPHANAVSPNPAKRIEEGELLRRELLRMMASGAVMTPAVRELIAHARVLMDAALDPSPRPATVAEWEAVALRYGDGYHGVPPPRVLNAVTADFLAVHACLDRPTTSAARGRMCAVAARLAGTAGIILHDLGEHEEASNWFFTAETAAREGADARLLAWVYARSAMIEINYGSPDRALARARRASIAAGDSVNASAALAAAVRARALSLLHAPREAVRALGCAEELLGRLGSEDAADTWYGYPLQKHLVHASHALTIAGLTAEATKMQDEADSLSKPTSWITKTLIGLDRARCIVRDGDPERGAVRATEALRALPPEYRSGLLAARAIEVSKAIPPHARMLIPVVNLRNIIR